MDGWSTEDSQEIVVGRRMRIGRRRGHMRGFRWIVTGVVVIVVGGLAVGGYYLYRPTGLAALPDQAVMAPGGYRASIGANNTINVGLEIRNAADVALTIVSAQILAPAGLTSTAQVVVPTGDGNKGFVIDGDLPAAAPVQLGTEAGDRNGIIVGRFTVDCEHRLASPSAAGERILVTIQVAGAQRVEELTPPVIGDVPWLTAMADRVCLDPLPTGTPEQPLPALPDATDAPPAN